MSFYKNEKPWDDPVGDNIRNAINNAISKVMNQAQELESQWASSLPSDYEFGKMCEKTGNFTLKYR